MAEDYIAQFHNWVTGEAMTEANLDGNIQNIITGLSGGSKAINIGKLLLAGTERINSAGNATLAATSLTKLTIDGVLLNDKTNVGWTDYSATSTIVGWASYTTKRIAYKVLFDICYVAFYIQGTSNSINASFTLPINSANPLGGTAYLYWGGAMVNHRDNGSLLTAAGSYILNPLGNTVTLSKDANPTGGNWTNANGKDVMGSFWYSI